MVSLYQWGNVYSEHCYDKVVEEGGFRCDVIEMVDRGDRCNITHHNRWRAHVMSGNTTN